jgi:hypothetical protein
MFFVRQIEERQQYLNRHYILAPVILSFAKHQVNLDFVSFVQTNLDRLCDYPFDAIYTSLVHTNLWHHDAWVFALAADWTGRVLGGY